MKKIFIALFVLILGANLNADESNKNKPSFDCKKARNETEKAICADSYLSHLDSAMARDFAQQRAIINKEGAQKLLENQRAWLKELVSCKSDKKCIEAKLYKRRIEILNFKDTAPNHPNPHYMQEKSIDLRNKDGKCLGDKLCKATMIGFGVNLTDKDYLNPNGAFLYLDDVGIAIVSDFNDFDIQKISKQKAFKEILPFDRDEDRLMTNFVSSISIWAFDDDFLEIFQLWGGCGAYCTEGESVAYFDIESLQIAKEDSPKLIAKFLNDSFCQRLGENAKKSDDYESNAPFNRCYKTLSKAQRYFYSQDFQRAVESHTNGGDLVFAQKYGRWFDTQSKAFLPTMPVRELLNDNANLRKIVVKKWEGEYCDKEFFSDNCDKDGCKCGEADFFNNERDSQVENFWVNGARFDGENLVVAIRFPHVLRSRDADIYFSYDEIAPFADGILKRVIKSYQSYKNDKRAK